MRRTSDESKRKWLANSTDFPMAILTSFYANDTVDSFAMLSVIWMHPIYHTSGECFGNFYLFRLTTLLQRTVFIFGAHAERTERMSHRSRRLREAYVEGDGCVRRKSTGKRNWLRS